MEGNEVGRTQEWSSSRKANRLCQNVDEVMEDEIDLVPPRCVDERVQYDASETLSPSHAGGSLRSSTNDSYELLASRFQTLRFNHEELIKIKDEYKADNAKLRKENNILRKENQELFSPKISSLENQLEDEREKHEVMVSTLRELVDKMEVNKRAEKAKEEDAQKRKEILETQLTELRKQLIESRKQLDSATCQIKERDEKHATTLSEIQCREQQFQESKKAIIDRHENKLKKETEAVASLKRDMIRVEGEKNLLRQDFEFYKRHANSMLQRERDLNARIRTVLDCTKCGGKDAG